MKNKKLTWVNILFALLTAAVMVVIFLFSCEDSDDSSERSGFFVKIIINILYGDYDTLSPARQTEIMDTLTHIIRKTAHFTVYTALGFCASFAVDRERLKSVKTAAVLGFAALYATSDEIHQYFVPGRACMLRDVLLDSCGAMFGILLSALVLLIFRRKKDRSGAVGK